jgi:hypothetical protein
MAKSVLHVVPHDQGWAVKREGNERVNSTHPTQKEAIDSARDLAKELDDIVIHRADGTIRERVTYSGSNGGNETTGEPQRDTIQRIGATRDDEVNARDVMSVGTRVRWSAVFAGVIVALAFYVLFNLLMLAVGLSTADTVNNRTAAITAGAISAIIMVGAMFLGGFVASRSTVGEQKDEAMAYGVLVWGTILVLLLAGGLGAGMGAFSELRQAAPGTVASAVAGNPSPDALKRELSLTDEQATRYAAMVQNPQNVPDREAVRRATWWTLAGVVLSLAAAIGGGLAGAGPDLVLRAVRPVRTDTVVAPQPA